MLSSWNQLQPNNKHLQKQLMSTSIANANPLMTATTMDSLQ